MITVEQLKIFLQDAKDKHTKLHGNDPTHDWVSFYANEVYDEIINEMHKETAGIIGLRAMKKVSESYPVTYVQNDRMTQLKINHVVPSDVITGNLPNKTILSERERIADIDLIQPDNPTEQGC